MIVDIFSINGKPCGGQGPIDPEAAELSGDVPFA